MKHALRTTVLMIATTVMATCTLHAEEALTPISLKAPDLSKTSSLMEAFNKRASGLEVEDRMLSIQDLSDLL